MITLGTTTIAQVLHERICLLFARLEGDPVTALALAQFDREAGYGQQGGECRETTYRRLVDALWAYEEVTGGKVHPVNAELDSIGVDSVENVCVSREHHASNM